MLTTYDTRGLQVTQIHADNEWACIHEEIRLENMNAVAAGEHVGGIEISSRALKEGTRDYVQRLPYKQYPKIMVIECVT